MSERRRAAAVAASMLALLAPASARAQEPAPAPAATTSAPGQVIDDPQLAPPPAAPRVLRSWEEALAMARAQSPDYRATYDSVVRAEAQGRIALAAVLPTAVAQGTYTHQFLVQDQALGPGTGAYPPPNVFAVAGTLAWTPLSPRAIHALGTAKAATRAAEEDFVERRRTLALAIVATMLETLAAERVAELSRVGLRAALERLTLAQAKTKYGSGTALDVDRAQQDVAAARALILSGDESLRQAREALGVALGSREAIGAPEDLALDRFEQTVASSCRLDDDVERRSDVRAAKARVEVAERGVDDAWLRLAPTLGLQSQLAWASEVSFGPQTTWNVQGVLTVPIWDGGVAYGYARDARAQADQARAALGSVRLQAIVNVTQATRAVSVTQAEREVAQAQRDLAARIDQRTREGYLHGLGTSLDLVTSAQALRQTEINLVLLQFQASQARIQAVLSHAECIY